MHPNIVARAASDPVKPLARCTMVDSWRLSRSVPRQNKLYLRNSLISAKLIFDIFEPYIFFDEFIPPV